MLLLENTDIRNVWERYWSSRSGATRFRRTGAPLGLRFDGYSIPKQRKRKV